MHDLINKISYFNDFFENELKDAWVFYIHLIQTDIQEDSIENSRILFSYVIIASLYLESFRAVMLNFFITYDIDIDLIKRGKWLPKDLNMNSKLWSGIVSCQKELSHIANNPLYFDAIKFFCDSDKSSLSRNIVSHDIISSLAKSKYITLQDIKNNTNHLIDSLISIHKISQIKRVKNKRKLYSHSTPKAVKRRLSQLEKAITQA
jgi:hypothetical protein